MKAKPKPGPSLLRGWSSIAGFLGQSPDTAQRYARNGMPVRREGRYVTANPDEISQWLGKQSGLDEPVQVATGDVDLSAALKKAVAEAKNKKRKR